MKKINVTGWYGFYLEKKKLIITIASSVKIYSEELDCLKNFKTIRYPFALDFDKKQSKVYVVTTENLVYCIDVDLLEIIGRHRISVERRSEIGIVGCKLLDYERVLFFLIHEQGRGLFAMKYDLGKKEPKILFSDNLSKYSIDGMNFQYFNSEFILLEDVYATKFATSEETALSKEFFLEEQYLNDEPKVVLHKLRNQKNKPITVLSISEEGEFYLIEELKSKISILDKSLNRIFTIEKTMIDGERLQYNSQQNLLVITEFCAKYGHMLLLKMKDGVVKAVREERAYDCIFRENDIILLMDRGKSKLYLYEELF